MDRLPKISIIMPTYNRADLIGETIASVCNQTFTDWELLIMDDGSDDDTEAVVSGIKDSRITFHKAARTGQVSKLKNSAIQISRGEWIAFIDSDDLWVSTKLEKQVAAMNQYPDAGFCLTGGYNFIRENEPVEYLYKEREGVKYGSFMIDMLQSKIAGHIPVLLFKKNCVLISGYFDEGKLFSDPDFILSLACNYNGILIYEPLYYRRLHAKGDSIQNWEKGYYDWIKVIRSFRRKKQIPDQIAREALFKLYINFGEKCLVYNRRQKAIHNFLRAWVHRPLSIIPLKKTTKGILYSFS